VRHPTIATPGATQARLVRLRLGHPLGLVSDEYIDILGAVDGSYATASCQGCTICRVLQCHTTLISAAEPSHEGAKDISRLG
jgi:hypothetical protein